MYFEQQSYRHMHIVTYLLMCSACRILYYLQESVCYVDRHFLLHK